MITHTISITELIWTLFCSVGLLYNAKLASATYTDWCYAKKNNGDELVVFNTRTCFLVYLSWAFVQFVFVLAGLAAMSQKAPTHRVVTPLQIIITSCFLLISAVLAITAFFNERTRRAIITKLLKETKQREAQGESKASFDS